MTAAADGDRAAVDPLFAALWVPCVAYATRFLGDAALAEDAAQEALVRLFGQLPQFARDSDALTWALAIVTWECRTVRQRRARRREDATASVEPSRDARDELEDRDLVRAALATLAELPARDLDTIATSLLEIRPTDATFRKRLERAVARLRLTWRSRHGTP